MKISYNSAKGNEEVENIAKNLRNMEARMSNIYLIRVPEGKIRENGVERVWGRDRHSETAKYQKIVK